MPVYSHSVEGQPRPRPWPCMPCADMLADSHHHNLQVVVSMASAKGETSLTLYWLLRILLEFVGEVIAGSAYETPDAHGVLGSHQVLADQVAGAVSRLGNTSLEF